MYRLSSKDTRKLFLNSSENKIYDDSGYVYSAEDLSYISRLTDEVDDLAFVGDAPLVLKENKLILYSAANREQSQFLLENIPNRIAATENRVFSFFVESGQVQVNFAELSSFSVPVRENKFDPATMPFKAELYANDDEDIVYMVDQDSLNIFRWSTVNAAYLSTWPLLEKPVQLSYSSNLKRLFVGYQNGKISYFDTTNNDSLQHHFTTLPGELYGMLAIENALYAQSDFFGQFVHFSLDVDGNLKQKADLSNGAQYL